MSRGVHTADCQSEKRIASALGRSGRSGLWKANRSQRLPSAKELRTSSRLLAWHMRRGKQRLLLQLGCWVLPHEESRRTHYDTLGGNMSACSLTEISRAGKPS